jgi:hypothetical protein
MPAWRRRDLKSCHRESAATARGAALDKKMLPFVENLKVARNKILSHNDLRTLLKDIPQGKFNIDTDVEYFGNLQEFVHIVHSKTALGGPFPFDQSVANDVQGFLGCWKRGLLTK